MLSVQVAEVKSCEVGSSPDSVSCCWFSVCICGMVSETVGCKEFGFVRKPMSLERACSSDQSVVVSVTGLRQSEAWSGSLEDSTASPF